MKISNVKLDLMTDPDMELEEELAQFHIGTEKETTLIWEISLIQSSP